MPVSSPAAPVEAVHPRWQRTLYILFASQLFTAIGFSSIYPFLPLYVEQLGSSTGLDIELLAGMVFSSQAITMMIASPFWGALADRYGRKLMVERAMFGGTVILLLMAFVQSAEQLVLLRAIQGLITGTVAAANAMAASIAPRHRMGYAMGLLQVGMGAGVAFGPLIGGTIADAYGYGAAFYVTAALLFLSGLLVWWGAEERFEPIQNQKDKKSGFGSRWRAILRTPGVLRTYGLRFLTQFGRSTILPIAPLFISSLLLDQSWLNTFTGLVEGISSVTTTLSAGVLGRLGDRTGHQRIIVISALAGAFFYLLQSRVSAAWQLLALQACVGVALGGIVPSISALLARFTNPDEAGAVYGLDNSISSAGRAMAPLLGSAVAVWFNLRAAFVATALLFLAMSFLAAQRLPDPEASTST